jgi:hypothetical protein
LTATGRNHTDVLLDILGYFAEHPDAQDTIEGIIEWWLMERHIIREAARVESALRELVSSGMVIRHQGRDRRERYRLNREKLPEVQDLLRKKQVE